MSVVSVVLLIDSNYPVPWWERERERERELVLRHRAAVPAYQQQSTRRPTGAAAKFLN